jgi:hypothetical protein
LIELLPNSVLLLRRHVPKGRAALEKSFPLRWC